MKKIIKTGFKTGLNFTLAFVVLFLFTFFKTKDKKQKPNILFIMTDEMRWDFMGVAGHTIVKTPALDRLADDGFYFHRTYTPHPVSVPARNTLFTSRYASVTGAERNNCNTRQGEFFLPSILQHFGYRTAISGKLHFNPKGPAYGFDEFYSYRDEGPDSLNWYNTYLFEKFGSQGPYPSVEGTRIYPNDPLGKDLGKYSRDSKHYEENWITMHASDFLSRQTKEEPWFLFVSFNRPHSPSVLPDPYYSMYKNAELKPLKITGELRRKDFPKSIKEQRHIIEDPEMADKLIRSYMGAITMVDDKISELIKILKVKGMYENTIIVFVADHGNMLGDKGRWFKGHMYEGSSRVPFIMKVPEGQVGVTGKGMKVEQIVELTDIMPTLLDLLDVKSEVNGMQGQSLLPLLKNDTTGCRNSAFGNLGDETMCVEGDYKFIYYSNNKEKEWEVFNLRTDPTESNNLSETGNIKVKLPGIKNKMEAILHQNPGPLKVKGMVLPEYARNPRPPLCLNPL